jgi:hypothetical protein
MGRIPLMGDQPIGKPLYVYRITQKRGIRTQDSSSRVIEDSTWVSVAIAIHRNVFHVDGSSIYRPNLSLASNVPRIAGLQPQLSRVTFIRLCVCSDGRSDIQHWRDINIVHFTAIIPVPIHVFTFSSSISTENWQAHDYKRKWQDK